MSSSIDKIFDVSARQMRLEMEAIRAASEHRGLKGGAAEGVLITWLKRHLPAAIGVTAGQVVDRTGRTSRQVDVLLYDALRSPLLFKAVGQEWDLVPCEGTIAVIEVKMHLTSSDLPSIEANCTSVCELVRDAYVGESTSSFEVAGEIHNDLPIQYAVFAFESDNMYAGRLNTIFSHHAKSSKPGSICYLDRGVSFHAEIRPDLSTTYSACPTRLGRLFDIEDGSNALLLWFLAFSNVILQAPGGRPIDLIAYASRHAGPHQGSFGGDTPEERRDLIVQAGVQVLGDRGVPVEIANSVCRKVMSRELGATVSETETEYLRRAGARVDTNEDGSLSLYM